MTHTTPSSAPDLVKVTRALISVSDKSGIIEFAKALASHGVEIISTGGTSTALAAAGIKVIPIESVTGFPEMMDGRVKTLHPKIHGGLLGLRDNPAHAAAMKEHAIAPIDLVCVNLYPFEKTVAKPNVDIHEAIENIDIGGPSMLRSAAKNSGFVLVVTDPSQYPAVIAELQSNNGATTKTLRQQFAAITFARTASYDAAIAAYLAPRFTDSTFPSLAGVRMQEELRYGENPHQTAALYAGSLTGDVTEGLPQSKQLHGKELSYNNLNDGAAALTLAAALGRNSGNPSACVIKHANPCGAATALTIFDAIDQAIAGDPLAAYGGIIAASHTIDIAAAERMCTKEVFFEVLIAPDYDEAALGILRQRWQNLRILKAPATAFKHQSGWECKSIPGGVLVQSRDVALATLAEYQHRAGPHPTSHQLAAALFLEPVCRSLTSNAVCIGGPTEKPGTTRLFGAGAGQMDRVASCKLAVSKAGALANGAIAYSDAFFPFNDGPQILIDAGVTCLIHTGGSKRDQDTFDLCDKHGVTCLTTGLRHFRH